MSDEYQIYKQAVLTVEKLSPKPGDFVVITFPSDCEPKQIEMLQIKMNEAFQDHLPDQCHALMVAGNIDIRHLPKDMMARYGWYKIGDQ